MYPNSSNEQLSVHTLQHAFKTLIKDGKFEGVGLHVFRHSLASNMATEGVDQRFIDKMLGHQTEAMRKRYQHLFPNPIKEVIAHVKYL